MAKSALLILLDCNLQTLIPAWGREAITKPDRAHKRKSCLNICSSSSEDELMMLSTQRESMVMSCLVKQQAWVVKIQHM